jgi:hypothetical protein
MIRCLVVFAFVTSIAFPAFGQEDLTAADMTSYKPETAAQRWNHLFVDTVASPAPYFAAAGAAGIDHLFNKPKEWGQGAEGYGDRVGSRFGRFMMTATISQATEAAFGLETRYVRSGSKGFLHRTGYALAATFFSYDREGHKRFNPGPVVGSFSSGILATQLWYPHRYDPLSKGLDLGVAELTVFPIGNLLREFRPELKPFLNKFKLGFLLP